MLIAIAGKQQILYACQRSETEREAVYNLQPNVPSSRDTPLTEFECGSIGYDLRADGSCCELQTKAVKISSLADFPRPGVEIKTVPDELAYLENLLSTCRTRIEGFAKLRDALLAPPPTNPSSQFVEGKSEGKDDVDSAGETGPHKAASTLPKYVEAAYQSYKVAAIRIGGETEPTDQQAYDWLNESGPPEYKLPETFKTWQRYVRKGRQHNNTPKHHRHNGQISRSAIRLSETN